jgi:hypothetical protein
MMLGEIAGKPQRPRGLEPDDCSNQIYNFWLLPRQNEAKMVNLFKRPVSPKSTALIKRLLHLKPSK